MNILALTSSYPRYDGDPTAPFIESITKGVAEMGHRVDLVLPASSAWRRPTSEGDVHYHIYRYTPFRSWTPWGYSGSLRGGVKIKRPLFALAPMVAASALHTANSVVAHGSIDLVHAHWAIPNGPIAARAARRHDLPLVVSLHGSDVAISERIKAIGRVTRHTLAGAAAVTAPSDDLLERAQRLGATRELTLIPYGADVEAMAADPVLVEQLRARLGIDPDRIVVIGIGRFVAMKGFSYLVDAIVRATRTRDDLHLVLVGDGDLRKELEARVDSAGAGTSVTFTGLADRDAIPTYLALADIVAVPSIHSHGHVDGLPNVALEAMAAGKSLIATDVGGLPQLVRDGENGVLIRERDADALAKAILDLANDADLRARLGRNAREEVRERRSWDVVARAFVDVFERVLAGR